jgi:hypothetical protein
VSSSFLSNQITSKFNSLVGRYVSINSFQHGKIKFIWLSRLKTIRKIMVEHDDRKEWKIEGFVHVLYFSSNVLPWKNQSIVDL